ncbi:regulatory protein RecX [Sneathiella aquimaris]|uniref:regulatory protein RecX n=1 Tax=Sneathiella aquimaris TaxID=2599305 RepID=UPI001469F61A|nr:regulatory protein RecX [Sneathiella aquimaris]
MTDELDDDFQHNKKKVKKEKPPKEISPALIRQQALRYLDRFAATTMKLRRHLMNKSSKAIEFHQTEPEAVLEIIDAEISKLVDAGILNDTEYAASKARSMGRQGKSSLQISVKLQSLGFKDNEADRALDQLREEEGYTERKAAAKYIKKRRFGPYKPDGESKERLQKELQTLVRNGFDYSLSKSLLTMERCEEIEEIIFASE